MTRVEKIENEDLDEDAMINDGNNPNDFGYPE